MSDSDELALAEQSEGKTFVGDELNLDLWVQSLAEEEKSMLIRKTTPDGASNSVLLHIKDKNIKVIPTFTNAVGQSLADTSAPAQVEYMSIKKSRSIIPFLEYVALILGVIFLVFSATGIFQTRVILTGSMKPTLDPGDVVFAIAPTVLKPEVGKTVIYTARDLGGRAVTQWAHRIISGSDKDGWTIKGDANPAADINSVPSSDIAGVVLFSIPFIGKFLNPFSLLTFGFFIIAFIFIYSRFRK